MTLKVSVIMIGFLIGTVNISGIAAAFGSQDPDRELTEKERESGFFNEEGYVNSVQFTRPPTNPDFDPDESCLFDAFQLKCVPGSQQECPENFGQNEDSTCVPKHDQCPEGYHVEDEDETGQCYPNDECDYDGYVLLTDRPDKRGDRCAYLRYLSGK